MKHQAISYLRYSSKGQASGDSERRQEDSFNQWLSRNLDNYRLYEPFRDFAKSGYTGRHIRGDGSLGRLIQQAEDGFFGEGDVLVVEAIDRLSRLEPLAALDLFQKLVATGLSIITLEDGQTYTSESLNSNGLALMMLVYKIQAAHEYSKRLGLRIRAVHEKKRTEVEKGKTEKIVSAAWLKDGKLYEPVAVLVRTAVAMYLDGYGTRAIAIKINSLIDASEISVKERYKKLVNPTTIRRWLSNPALIGDWQSKEGLIKSCFEPLIKHNEWIKIQNELQARKDKKIKAGTVNHYKLSSLIICGCCGSPFTVRVQKPKPTLAAPLGSKAYAEKPAIRYLNCGKYLKSGSCSNNVTWPYQVLEFIYEQTINECLYQIAMGIPVSKKAEAEINSIMEEIAKAEIENRRMYDLYISFGDDKVKLQYGESLERLKNLKDKKDALVIIQNSTRINNGEEFGDGYKSEPIKCPPWENSDAIGRRKLLKDAGYEILINSKEATCWYGSKRWNLIKRNQLSCTYTVHEISSEDGLDELSEYVAVNQDGKAIARAESLSSLALMLDGKSQGS